MPSLICKKSCWIFASIVLCLSLSNCASAPKKKPSFMAIGNEYAKDGLLREAAEAYKKALARKPKNAMARRNLGIVLIKSGAYKLAVKNLEKIIGRFDQDFETNYYLGEAYRAVEKYSEAIYRYQKALKIKSTNIKAMKSLAWSYYKIRAYREALQVGKELRKASPGDGQVAIILGRTLLKLNKLRAAISIIRKAKASTPSSSLPYFQSVEGDILLAFGNCQKAIKVYRLALKVQPLLAGSLLGLGRCHLETKQFDKAITYMERAIKIRPRLTETLFYLGKAYENKDRKKSIKFYKAFRKKAAQDPEQLSHVSEVKKRISALRTTAKANVKRKSTKDKPLQ